MHITWTLQHGHASASIYELTQSKEINVLH